MYDLDPMKKTLIVILLLTGIGVSVALLLRTPDQPVQAQLEAAALVDLSGFKRAEGPIPLQFPEDHGPHPDYQTEWWYYTGNLETAEGRHFGYQLTFFRRALKAQSQDRASDWASNQVFMAHFTVTDVAEKDFYAHERLERGAVGLAGAGSNPFSVWLEDWRVSAIGQDQYQLVASVPADDKTGPLALSLTLVDERGPVLQGDQGYSRKGPDPGQASYYYSLTHLQSQGTLIIGSQQFSVSGLSWMDHEYSTSALSTNQVGWDWFALQLDNDSELVVFHIRQADGQVDPYSSGTLINPDNRQLALTRDDFEITVENTWRSPHSGSEYPSGWRVRVPAEEIDLIVRPYIEDQELNVSYTYWEGAVQISGIFRGQDVQGSGYVELTGYSGSMGGEF